MIGNKKCPYCGETLERGLISGPSSLYKDDVRYIGCAECGKTSILYKNGNVMPIMAHKNSASEVSNVIEKDISTAFRSADVIQVFAYDLKNAVNKKAINDIDKEKDNKENVLISLKDMIEKGNAKVIPIGIEDDEVSEKQIEEMFSKICDSLAQHLAKKEKEEEDKNSIELAKVIQPTPKLETTELKIEEAMANTSTMTRETTMSIVEDKKGKKERHSYTLIDEYDEAYVYQNVTVEELLDAMKYDGHEENEFHRMKLYRLDQPLKFSVKKSITIE